MYLVLDSCFSVFYFSVIRFLWNLLESSSPFVLLLLKGNVCAEIIEDWLLSLVSWDLTPLNFCTYFFSPFTSQVVQARLFISSWFTLGIWNPCFCGDVYTFLVLIGQSRDSSHDFSPNHNSLNFPPERNVPMWRNKRCVFCPMLLLVPW